MVSLFVAKHWLKVVRLNPPWFSMAGFDEAFHFQRKPEGPVSGPLRAPYALFRDAAWAAAGAPPV